MIASVRQLYRNVHPSRVNVNIAVVHPHGSKNLVRRILHQVVFQRLRVQIYPEIVVLIAVLSVYLELELVIRVLLLGRIREGSENWYGLPDLG